MGDVPLDELGEYDFYLPHTARLVLAGADPFNIAAYVRQVVRVDLALSIFPEHRIVEFTQECSYLMA